MGWHQTLQRQQAPKVALRLLVHCHFDSSFANARVLCRWGGQRIQAPTLAAACAQARHLTHALRERLKGADLCVSHSLVKCVVEVRIAGVNKGTVADDVIRAAEHDAPIDFILCIGDDEEDEYMLSATTARASSPEMRERLRDRLFTVTIGSKPASHAQFLADNSREVLQLLEIVRQDKTSSRG